MKRTIQILIMDIQRSFISLGFLVAVFGICIVYYIGAWSEVHLSPDILYLSKYSAEVSNFGTLITLFCSLPYTTAFCSDWNSKYIRLSIIRSGPIKYGLSKIIACGLSAGSSIVIGMTMFLISLSPWFRFVSTSASNYNFFATQTLGGSFLLNGQYALYFAIYIYLTFLAGMFWSTTGLCISAYIPNKFVALFTPFIISYILNIITNTFPVWLRLNRIADGSCILNGTLFSLVYATFVFVVLTVVVCVLFINAVKRRLSNA